MNLNLQNNSDCVVPLICRTCSKYKDRKEVYVNVTRKCNVNHSVKDIIIMLVPQMAETLLDTHSVCNTCFNVIANCVKFIEKCLETEKKLKVQTEILENDYSDYEEVLPAIKIAKSSIETDNGLSLDLKGEVPTKLKEKKGVNQDPITIDTYSTFNTNFLHPDKSKAQIAKSGIEIAGNGLPLQLNSEASTKLKKKNGENQDSITSDAYTRPAIKILSGIEIADNGLPLDLKGNVSTKLMEERAVNHDPITYDTLYLILNANFSYPDECKPVGELSEDYIVISDEDTEGSLSQDHIVTNDTKSAEDQCPRHDYLTNGTTADSFDVPDNIDKHNRIVSLEQTSSNLVQDFISDLEQSGVKVLRASNDSEAAVTKTKKRILLLGTHVFNMDYKCPKCLKCLENRQKFNAHTLTCKKIRSESSKMEDEELMHCIFCEKNLKKKHMELHLIRHEQREEQKRLAKERRETLQCRSCFERFTSKDDYQIHLEIHPPYICDKCGKGFAQSASLGSHKRSHNEPNSYICEVCGKGYKERSMLTAHRKIHENNNFKCPMCSKIFKNKVRAQRHIKCVHTTSFSHQCARCGKLFKQIRTYNEHVRLVHMKVKPYTCKICDRQFGRADYLRRHIMTHTGEPNNYRLNGTRGKRLNTKKYNNNKKEPLAFSCKFCGKWFLGKPKLKLHLETHVKIRRFPCQYCPLTFARKQFCKKHELSHKNWENFYRCNICWRRLCSKEELDAHVETKHPNPRYPCDVCGKKFHRVYLLNHHVLLEHRTPEDTEKAKRIVYESLLEIVEGELSTTN